MAVSRPTLLIALVVASAQCSGQARAADWPRWGGTTGHNMVSSETGLPVRHAVTVGRDPTLVLFHFNRQGLEVLGKQKLCGKTLMHPTIAAGRLYVRDAERLSCYDMKL